MDVSKYVPRRRPGLGEDGIALVVTLMVTFIVTSLVTAAAVIGSNHTVANLSYQRSAQLAQASEDGLEVGRAMINGVDDMYPDSGFTAIESGVQVLDGSGNPVPGLRRWVYAGPIGITSGQYGVFGAVVSVVTDLSGGVAVRRADVFQESFAKYAYFTDIEPSDISFGGGDQIWGPVHTNSDLKIYSSGTTFHSETRTAGDVVGGQYGTFKKGYEENVTEIDMPETADLNKLRAQGQAGNTHIIGGFSGEHGEATTRLEFMALDLNGDGDTTDPDEGFMRVYQSDDSRWVSGDVLLLQWNDTELCGDYHGSTYVPAGDHPSGGHLSFDALSSSSRRCFLGGDDRIWGGFDADDSHGEWLEWPGSTPGVVAGRDDADYLFPLSRRLNPTFRGVIFVDGDVVISGTLRGRVTIAATGEIIIGDDMVYATDPGAGTCSDILGLFSGSNVVMADNALNAPQNWGWGDYSYDDTRDEFVHGVVLALGIFTVENYADGSRSAQPCEGTTAGRGCLYLTGGIVQRQRGAVGTINSSGISGNVKRYSYDACAATQPPPYFPTTGYFARGQYYQVDPAGFDIQSYLAKLTALGG